MKKLLRMLVIALALLAVLAVPVLARGPKGASPGRPKEAPRGRPDSESGGPPEWASAGSPKGASNGRPDKGTRGLNGPAGNGRGAGKAALYNNPAYECPEGAIPEEGAPTFGFVIMNTNAEEVPIVIVQVSLKGATPDVTYDIWVNQYEGACPHDSPTHPGALTTNSRGNGNAHVEVERVEGATQFWVSATGGARVLRSTAVELD